MFWPFSSRAKRKKTAAAIYQHCVARGRAPVFYDIINVPDTLDGRFGWICMHVCLVVDRLYRCHEPMETLGQAVFDVMFADVEDNLREHGIGDLSVPRQMKRMMQRYNGCQHAYAGALHNGDDVSLRDAIARNIYGAYEDSGVENEVLDAMCNYVRRCEYALIEQDDSTVGNGHIRFASLPLAQKEPYKDYA